jgi:hypothetical protein
MANVTLFRIRTEMHDGSDVGGVDNVSVGSRFAAAFNSGPDGWSAAGDGTMAWMSSGGNPGGYVQISDWASGDWHWASAPITWAGDWRALIGSSISFDVKTNYPDYAAIVEISCQESRRMTVSADPWTLAPGGSSSGTVTLGQSPMQDVVVTLQASAPGCISVPASVTVPRGQTSASFRAQAAANASPGCESVITASHPDYGEARMTLRVAGGATPTPTRRIGNHPPHVEWIECPEQFPADGTKVTGRVKFWDDGGDINWADFQVLSGDFNPFSFNPMDYDLEEGDANEGVFTFIIWCNSPTEVTLRLVLKDADGSTSSNYDFSFACGEGAPVDEGLLKPVSLPAGLTLPPNTTARAYESLVDLGTIFFDPAGTAYIFSHQRGIQQLLAVDRQANTRVYIESDLLAGCNEKAGVWLGGDVMVLLDGYRECGNDFAGIYRLHPDGTYAELLSNGSGNYSGLGDLIANPQGGYWFCEFESKDNVFSWSGQGQPVALLSAGDIPGGAWRLCYDGTGGGLYLLNSVGGWPFGQRGSAVAGVYKIVGNQAKLSVASPKDGDWTGADISQGGTFGHAMYVSEPLTSSVRKTGGTSTTATITGLKNPGDLAFNPVTNDLLVVYDGKYLLWVH